MTPFLAEFIGTAVIILLGNGVVANVVLQQTKGNGGGWIVITFGWAMAVFVGVYMSAAASGAHLNPAVTIALAVQNANYALLTTYIPAQILGAMTGAGLVWLFYRQHYQATTDANLKMATFCTAPAIRNVFQNLLSEIIGTFLLMLGILLMTKPEMKLGTLDALPVALLVFAIGLSLGGTTGYAINPARDLGPRIMHFILPIAGKRDSDWRYAWIPVIGPIVGALLAVLAMQKLA